MFAYFFFFLSYKVIPHDNKDMLPPPTPEPSPKPQHRCSHSSRGGGGRNYPRGMPSDLSLSTITEEPSQYEEPTQYSSHEIIVHPEVLVETTMPGAAMYSGGSSSSEVSSFALRLDVLIACCDTNLLFSMMSTKFPWFHNYECMNK